MDLNELPLGEVSAEEVANAGLYTEYRLGGWRLQYGMRPCKKAIQRRIYLLEDLARGGLSVFSRQPERSARLPADDGQPGLYPIES